MNPEVFEQIVACTKLPSLPAVAVRVLELTGDSNVNMRDLAETIQNDQALAAKILKTVNSSFYGLRKRCSTINQAIVMLGLSAVKTLALGFSLVTAISGSENPQFDFVSYWRRGLYSGIAGKQIAKAAKAGFEEECFLGGLLQDVGMLGLAQALGDQYASVMWTAGRNHRGLMKLELESIETHHGEIGAMMARRWKLPDELIMPIKYHERPTAAPVEHLSIVRAVGLGNIAADVLTLAGESSAPLSRFYAKAEQWFAMSNSQADDVLKGISAAAKELGNLLQIDAGEAPDAEAVLKEAQERLLAIEVPDAGEASEREQGGAPGVGGEHQDDVTGLPGRRRFDQLAVAAFEQARAGAGPLSVAIFEIDDLERIGVAHGRPGADEVLASLAERLEQQFRPLSGHVFRYGAGQFAVLLARTDRVSATRAAETARAKCHAAPVKLPASPRGSPGVTVSTSVGVASLEPRAIGQTDDVSSLTGFAEKAVLAAKRAGCNTVRVYAPAAKAA